MALSAQTIFEVQTTGNDTSNGGGFDAGVTGMATDGAATSANTSAPVFSSASYSFVAGDVGAWVFIKSGTNWIPGWYKISSVASGQATLDATLGHGVLYTNSQAWGISTATGCASVASPTAATWSIDYSQQATAPISYTDLSAAGAGSTLTSAANPFGKQQIGNLIQITSGTNLSVGVYAIASVTGTTATFDRAVSTGASSNGAGNLGGAFATPGKVASLINNGPKGPDCFIKAGTYTTTSTSNNVAGGNVAYNTLNGGGVDQTNYSRWIGYNSTRFDDGTPPLLKAGVGNTGTLMQLAALCMARNLKFDGSSNGSFTTGLAFSASGSGKSIAYRVIAQNFTGSGVGIQASTIGCVLLSCYASGCATGISTSSAQTAVVGCIAKGCSTAGFNLNGVGNFCAFCVATSNTGITTDGFTNVGNGSAIVNCISYNNGRAGFGFAAALSTCMLNCIAYGNTGVGYSPQGVENGLFLTNCASGGNSSDYVSADIFPSFIINFVTLSGNPFTNAASDDFSLNSSAGNVCKGAGFPGTLFNFSTTGYIDIGVAQHQVSAPSAVTRAFAWCS